MKKNFKCPADFKTDKIDRQLALLIVNAHYAFQQHFFLAVGEQYTTIRKPSRPRTPIISRKRYWPTVDCPTPVRQRTLTVSTTIVATRTPSTAAWSACRTMACCKRSAAVRIRVNTASSHNVQMCKLHFIFSDKVHKRNRPFCVLFCWKKLRKYLVVSDIFCTFAVSFEWAEKRDDGHPV